MKKVNTYAVLIFFIILGIFISGCSFNDVTLNTELILDENFSGERIITLNIKDSVLSPKSFESAGLSEFIFSKVPKVFDVKKVRKNNSTDYKFILRFNTIDDYRSKIKSLLNDDAEVSSFYSKDNILTRGIKIFENFSSKDLFNFLNLDSEKNDNAKVLKNMKLAGTKVIFNGESNWTNSNISFSKVEFLPVEKITIYTKNNLDGTYDREFKIKFSKEVYSKLGSNLYDYIYSLKDDMCFSFGETSSDEFQEYNLSYLKLDLDSLKSVTSKFFNLSSKNNDLKYGVDLSKTTFVEKDDLFSEYLDLSAFSSDNKNIKLDYFYECQNEIPDINLYNDLKWNNYDKKLVKKAYLVESDSNIFKVQIYDKKCYTVDGLDFNLDHKEGEFFKKSLKIKYSKENEGSFDYLKKYLELKGINENLSFLSLEKEFVCELFKEGKISDISKYYSDIFGIKNFSKFTVKGYDFGFFDTIKVRDSISLLNSDIDTKSIPVSYTVSDSDEDLGKSVKYNIGYKKIRVPFSKEAPFDAKFNVKNDNFVVTYKYNQRNSLKVIIGFLIIIFILCFVICIIFLVNLKAKKTLEVNDDARD